MATTKMKVMIGLMLVTSLMLARVPRAEAQTSEPTVFLNVNLGAQAHNHTFPVSESFAVYDETATVTSTQGVNGGLLFDVSGAVRVWRSLAAGAGFSIFNDTGEASVVAVVPNPIFFDTPKTVTTSAEGLERREVGIHIQAIWFLPVPDFLPDDARIAFAAGPSFFNLRQQLVTSATVPAGTQNAVPVIEVQSKTGVGLNGGLDLTVPVSSRYGIGAFVRYAGGEVDLPSVSELKVGGFQVGGGIRVAF